MDTVNTVILYFYCFRFARLLVILSHLACQLDERLQSNAIPCERGSRLIAYSSSPVSANS